MEGEELVNNLRQLVINFEPFLRTAPTYHDAEEILLNLEEHDENFHRYKFVSQLKAKIDDSLGGLIEDEIEQCSTGASSDIAAEQQSLVQKVTERVFNSKEFDSLGHYIQSNVAQAVQTLHENFTEEFGGERRDYDYHHEKRNPDNELDIDCSFSSSIYQSSLMFMSQEQAHLLAENLDPRRMLEDRLKAIQSLCSIPPADTVNSEQWQELKRGLFAALVDNDPTLSSRALKFLARGFSSSINQTKEIYLLLVDYLSDLCKKNLSKSKTGIDLRKPEHIRIMQAFSLLNEYQHHAPSYWVRCPESMVEQILDSTLKMLVMQHTSPLGIGATNTPMTALHFVALLDPKAVWFSKWMHGIYSRMPLLKKLEEHKRIVENSVKHCMEFCNSRKIPFDLMSDISDTLSRESLGEGRRMHYTRHEMDYAYFIHSLSLISKLLCHAGGRKFFPIKVKDISEPVTITKLLVNLIQLISDPSNVGVKMSVASHQYDPAILVTDVLKTLCSHRDVCASCLCKDDITNSLLAPIAYWLDDEDGHGCTEVAYLHIADILGQLASTSHGRQHLLYGEGQERFSRTKSSAAHTIADFTKKAINYDLPGDYAPPSNKLTGAFVYICRQLYTTCEGLLPMSSYELHSTLAEALNEALREFERASTPTPGSDSSSPEENDSKSLLAWIDTLKDNLLSMAASPKGVLLLQLTQTMPDCLSYMFNRYRQKLQVSKYEKFGYGSMVSRVAATAAGMMAIRDAGFVKMFVNDVWGILECGEEDTAVFYGQVWPIVPIDKTAQKPLLNLLKIVTSYPAVYELLYEQVLPSKGEYSFREMPHNIVGLIDRLVVMDTDVKMHSLFNYEQSHVFGLRMLSVMTSCLDTFLLLQSQYRIQEVLLAGQELNVLEDRDMVIDMLALERNYILAKTYIVGGPSERIIPPRTISEDRSHVFPYPIISNYPIPREYIPNVAGRSAMKQENELSRFLAETKNTVYEHDWMDRCRETFCLILETKAEQAKGNVLQDLLEKVLEAAVQDETTFPLITYSEQPQGTDSALRSFLLSPLQQLGVKIAVRYGMHLKLLNSSNEATDNLSQLLKQCGYFFQQQQRAANSGLRFLRSKNYPGFDWFASTVFLLMNGSLDRSWKFLYQFSTLISSVYLWLPRLHRSVHLPQPIMNSGIPPMFSSSAHNVELILEAEVPLVYSAFRMSGYNAAEICQHWLRQCFWNYLDWIDIVHYVCLCILMGVDYQVYLCVAIMRYLEKDILLHQQEQDLIIFLKEEPIRGFRIGQHLDFMKDLERKFRKTVLADMHNISRP